MEHSHKPSQSPVAVSSTTGVPADGGSPFRFDSRNWKRQLWQVALILLLSTAAYRLIAGCVLQMVEVVGVSMTPALPEGSRHLLNRWAFSSRPPERADVVVIRDPSDDGFSVKRVVAVAGESVLIKNGRVFVNGRELHEPYLRPGTPTRCNSRFSGQPVRLAPGQYFLLGDNRTNSIDSRCYGAVPEANILGLVEVR